VASGSSGYSIRRWFDQSPNRRVAVQDVLNSAHQLKLIPDGGASNFMAVARDQTSSRLLFDQAFHLTGPFTVSMVVQGVECASIKTANGDSYIRIDNENFHVYRISGINKNLVQSGNTTNLRHIFIARDSSNVITTYVNGVSKGTVTQSGTFTVDAISNIFYDASSRTMELIVWSEDKNSEVSAHYNEAKSRYNNEF
jgi:hypothetical protein